MKIVYSADGKTAFYCGYKFRKDPKTGYYLSSKKTTANKRERLHEFVWRNINGKIPEGYHIHHIDRDKDNNDIDNLEMLSQQEHAYKHNEMRTEEEKQKLRENIVKYAVPRAKEWHSSEEGKQWHSKHAIEIFKNKQPQEHKCTFCGCIFITKKSYGETANRFCSNACRAAFRRKSGVDNIEKCCEECGKTYISSKYAKTHFCAECGNKRHKRNRESRCVQYGSKT